MGLFTEQDGAFDEYEAVVVPRVAGVAGAAGPAAGGTDEAGPDTGGAGEAGPAVFLRRSARPSRRAVLHVHDLSGSFVPADLARWYNERGFHFYVTDIDRREATAAAARRRPADGLRSCFAALDAARLYLRESAGIDAIILSAQESAAVVAAYWCESRRESGPADALILSRPEFGRARRTRLDIGCPVLVISAGDQGGDGRGRQGRRGREPVSLGLHVTWLHLDDGLADGEQRRRLFDEMGRWLGAYMYGQVRDKLL